MGRFGKDSDFMRIPARKPCPGNGQRDAMLFASRCMGMSFRPCDYFFEAPLSRIDTIEKSVKHMAPKPISTREGTKNLALKSASS